MSNSRSALSTAESGSSLMRSIRAFAVPSDSLVFWFLGQNGFLLKSHEGTLFAIDPYLTDSCRARSAGPLDLGRCLPIFIRPEDLDVDVFIATHSHQDHLDEETVRRLRCRPRFVAPWDARERLLSFGFSPTRCFLLHPGERLQLGSATLQGTFALPTDNTDLNHIGVLIEFANGVRFYNTGDTAFAEGLTKLLPRSIDICAICMNGKFGNLDCAQAADIVRALRPRIAVPTHFDMMVCNLSDPEVFRDQVARESPDTQVCMMDYARPFLYRRTAP